MTDNQALVLRARNQTPAAPAAETATEALDIEMRRAQAISQAVQALPPAYQKQPGAVLLVDQWARSHGVDTLTAIQTVTFFKGKPIVAADMQRALATKAGYQVDITEGEGWAELTVTRNGKSKSARFTIEEAEKAGLTSKDVWKNYQSDMLVARATARCLRRHAPEVVLGLADPDEIDTPIEILQAAAAAEPIVEVEQESGSLGEAPVPPPEPAEVDERTAVEISGDPRDAVFDTPPPTVIPKATPTPAPEPEAKAFEPVDPATFKSMLMAETKWNSIRLLKELANVGESNITIDQVCEDERLHGIATAIIQNDPT